MADAPQGDFLVLSGISKRYGGVRALENVDFACGRGKIHAVLGENGAGKSTLIKIVAGVVQPGRGLDCARRPAAALQQSRRGDGRGHSLHLPGTLADAGPLGRRQYLDRRAAETLRPHRRARPASPGRGAIGRSRMRGRQSASPRARSAAVAPPDGRDRQGARAKAEAAHPRRGDLGADQRRRREGLFAAGAAEIRGRRHPLHHPSHARGRGARGPRLGVPQRAPYRDLRQGRALDRGNRPTDDRARHRNAISAQAETRAAARGAQSGWSRLGEPS